MSETIERGTMQALDATGHTEIKWDPKVPAEVRIAKDMFDEMRAKGHSIFEINGRNQQGTRAETFNPEVRQYMVVPQLRGG